MKQFTILIGALSLIFFASCSDDSETPSLADLTTEEVTEITAISAKSGGNIISDGGASVTARGVCWSTNPSPTISDSKTNDGSGGGTFISLMTGLTANTSYYVRAYTTTSNGTAYGLTYSFTTMDGTIAITTNDVSEITIMSAKSGGNITADGGSVITARGVCWNTNPNPTISNSKTIDGVSTGTFESNLLNLNYSTTYYLRAYATNSIGTFYGEQKTFTTLTPIFVEGSGVTDIDGNNYRTVILNNQEWMAENLRSSKYANGDIIPNVTDNSEWENLSTGAWSYYNNDSQFNIVYGKLYNWIGVDDSRNVCPSGWHVASDVEWTALENYLGGTDIAGGKLKEVGTSHWLSPNIDATNESGLTIRPGGYRFANGQFTAIGMDGNFWTSTEFDNFGSPFIWARSLSHQLGSSFRGNEPKSNSQIGFAVRCIKD